MRGGGQREVVRSAVAKAVICLKLQAPAVHRLRPCLHPQDSRNNDTWNLPFDQSGIALMRGTALKLLRNPRFVVPSMTLQRRVVHLRATQVISDAHTCRNGEPGRTGGVVQPADCMLQRGDAFSIEAPLAHDPYHARSSHVLEVRHSISPTETC